MKYVKSASEELLDLSVKLNDRMAEFRRSPNNDDYDAGFIDGAREVLNDAIHTIHRRIEELLGEG